jgi:hypothetical protein
VTGQCLKKLRKQTTITGVRDSRGPAEPPAEKKRAGRTPLEINGCMLRGAGNAIKEIPGNCDADRNRHCCDDQNQGSGYLRLHRIDAGTLSLDDP